MTLYPRKIEKGKGNPSRVLVLAPHADDETFGAGGALRWHVENGDHVHVIIFSDNTASVDGSTDTEKTIAEMRENEFREAMTALGVTKTTLLGLNDEEFRQKDPKNPSMERLLIENQPDLLYLPSLFDNHQDHRTLNIWAGNALKQLPNNNIVCRGYEVWSPLPATAVLDITPMVDIKQQAIRCYRSQLQNIRYDHHITGLNAYRAMTFGKEVMYAEAFLEMPANDYVAFIDMYLVS